MIFFHNEHNLPRSARSEIGHCKITFQTWTGFINWTIFQLNMLPPRGWAVSSDDDETRTFYENMYSNMLVCGENKVHSLMKYWQQNQVEGENCQKNVKCFGTYSHLYYLYTRDQLFFAGQDLIRWDVEGVVEEKHYSLRYQPHKEVPRHTGEAVVVFYHEKAKFFFATKTFWKSNLDSVNTVLDADMLSISHLFDDEMLESFVRNNQADPKSLKQRSIEKVVENFSHAGQDSVHIFDEKRALRTTFHKHLWSFLKSVGGHGLAAQITPKVIENMVVKAMIDMYMGEDPSKRETTLKLHFVDE